MLKIINYITLPAIPQQRLEQFMSSIGMRLISATNEKMEINEVVNEDEEIFDTIPYQYN
ncbi:hypothetical protein [Legionella lansingensis]|nr:hypothetical protein [Legionella lansingensis]